jgi:hypothetical protein
MQVPELVDDEVQTTEGDLGVWLHLLNAVKVEDNTHLKHNEYVRKRPLYNTPIVGIVSFDNMYRRITHRESEA